MKVSYIGLIILICVFILNQMTIKEQKLTIEHYKKLSKYTICCTCPPSRPTIDDFQKHIKELNDELESCKNEL